MKTFTLSLILSFIGISNFGISYAVAQVVKPTELAYACEVILVAPGIPLDKGVWKFSAPVSSGSHGGEPKVFKEGTHEVQVMADAQWLGVSWSSAGRKIAEGVFVLGNMDRTMNRVAILYDPQVDGAQASIGCTESLQ